MDKTPTRQGSFRSKTVRSRVEKLLRLLENQREAIVLTHNNPDPDSIASSWGVAWLLEHTAHIRCEILYGGVLGRAENRTMVEILGTPLKPADESMLTTGKPVILVDTQPGAGNHILPPSVAPIAVIDHHLPSPGTEAVPFHNVETQLGATATIVTQYFWALDIEPPTALATALFYGIKTDTLGLSRGGTRMDARAYLFLHERADLAALGAIERAPLCKEYFAVVDRALRGSLLYGDVVISTLGEIQHADMTSEIADLLARLEGMRWVLCVGTYQGALILSLRTTDHNLSAGEVIQKIVAVRGQAGGHNLMAGGRIPYSSSRRAAQQQIIGRFIEIMGLSAAPGERLIPR